MERQYQERLAQMMDEHEAELKKREIDQQEKMEADKERYMDL